MRLLGPRQTWGVSSAWVSLLNPAEDAKRQPHPPNHTLTPTSLKSSKSCGAKYKVCDCGTHMLQHLVGIDSIIYLWSQFSHGDLRMWGMRMTAQWHEDAQQNVPLEVILPHNHDAWEQTNIHINREELPPRHLMIPHTHMRVHSYTE